ncbi:MAG TPA: type II toxin-antitoxin system VapC family toxin [Acidimicrobiia bacterium]
MPERLVVDASAMVDLIVRSPLAPSVAKRLRGHELHAPAHFDAEVLSALGRLQRSGDMSARQVSARLGRIADAPIRRHHLAPLLVGAWKIHHNLRLVDALYVELTGKLDAIFVTTDAGLAAAAPAAHLVGTGD